jgi:hypothetical protein
MTKIFKSLRNIILMLSFCFLVFVVFFGYKYFDRGYTENGPKVVADSKNLEFSVSECGNSYWGNIVKDAYWEGNKLIVQVVDSMNCCPKKVSGSYKIENDKISFFVSESSGFIVCACNCDNTATFEISNIDKKEYTLNFSKDKLVLLPNNNVVDECVDDKTFDCYKNLRFPNRGKEVKNTDLEEVEQVFVFSNKEDEILFNQYPKFLEYFKTYEPNRYSKDDRYYEFEYKPEGSCLSLTKRTFRNGKEVGMSQECGLGTGDSLEEILVNYINEKENRFSSNSLFEQIKNRTGLNLTYMDSDVRAIRFGFRFIYNGEHVEYDSASGIEFLDRDMKVDVDYAKKYPRAEKITRAQIDSIIIMTDRIYKVIENMSKLDIESQKSFYVDIDENEEYAEFSSKTFFSEEDNPIYSTIHGNKIRLELPSEKRYKVNLHTWEIETL